MSEEEVHDHLEQIPFDIDCIPFNVSESYDVQSIVGEGAYGVVVCVKNPRTSSIPLRLHLTLVARGAKFTVLPVAAWNK